ncbi:MAG: septum formation protein Maf, partial [Phycisphaerales bacterium]|nr:septum formation protein Maf [Phycisphaerales bacterium]
MNPDIPIFQSTSDQPMPHIVLASASPRRRAMLEAVGVEHRVAPAQVDDGELVPSEHVNAWEWVAALAFLKASSSARTIQDEAIDAQIVVIGADTVCVHNGEIIGQPEDREHAKQIIEMMSDATHEVLTGVALLDANGDRRDLFVDQSVVTVGVISDEQIEEYLDSEQWRGKAGAYNITERLAAGWPIEFTGDETSIVGLPMTRTLERVS